jgi:small subunit ribosomal protein S8
MSMTDPLADFLTHIRNALMRKHASVSIPGSKLKAEVAKVLKQEGFIEDWDTEEDARGHMRIRVTLRYDRQGESVIRGLQRVSRPGLRRHMGYREMVPVYNGQGVAIVSTSQGIATDAECRDRKVGGEMLCRVW